MPEAERFKYELRNWYPHMKPADIAIWERFILKNPAYFDEVQYDVNVGSAPAFDTIVNPATGGSAEQLYLRKIDVVGWKNGKPSIVEIKPNAGTAALGQVVGYLRLYERDNLPKATPTAIVITDRIGTDMEELADHFAVKLEVA